MLKPIIIILSICILIFIGVILYRLLLSNKKIGVDSILNECRSIMNASPKKQPTKPVVSDNEKALINELKQLKKEIEGLKEKVAHIETRRNKDIKAINERFDVISKKVIDIASKKSAEAKRSQEMIAPQVKKDVEVAKYPQVVYAHYADSENPVGFSLSVLRKTPEGCFFKITIQSPTQASFSLIEDEVIMDNAVQAMSTIVTPCCTYDISEPITNKYKTMSEGKLSIVNNLWQVETKSKISFI